jgi:hypothetical protein
MSHREDGALELEHSNGDKTEIKFSRIQSWTIRQHCLWVNHQDHIQVIPLHTLSSFNIRFNTHAGKRVVRHDDHHPARSNGRQ